MYPMEKNELFKVTNKNAHILLTKLTKRCVIRTSGGILPLPNVRSLPGSYCFCSYKIQ